MLHRAGKEFMVRIRFCWQPLFQGRYLLLTNTVSGGGMLGLGDILQQTRETYKDPARVRDWSRTGETERQVVQHPSIHKHKRNNYKYKSKHNNIKKIKAHN